MNAPIVMQDWVTMRGSTYTGAQTYHQHRDSWLWTGDSHAVVLVVEVSDSYVSTGTNYPTLRIETTASEDGPWTTVDSWSDTGDRKVYLLRSPELTDAQKVEGFLRWVVRGAQTENCTWSISFRISAVMEPVSK